jgi:hypothetical protein
VFEDDFTKREDDEEELKKKINDWLPRYKNYHLVQPLGQIKRSF